MPKALQLIHGRTGNPAGRKATGQGRRGSHSFPRSIYWAPKYVPSTLWKRDSGAIGNVSEHDGPSLPQPLQIFFGKSPSHTGPGVTRWSFGFTGPRPCCSSPLHLDIVKARHHLLREDFLACSLTNFSLHNVYICIFKFLLYF